MTSRPAFLDGNRVTLLETGQAYFPALEQAIRAAQSDVILETYIFQDDRVGRQIVAALADAAARNVQVRVLVDGFGSQAFVTSLMPHLQAAGVLVMVFRREIRRLALRRHRLRRLHRKLVLIDGKTAFVGGINIIDDFDATAPRHPRHDYAVRLEGPLVAQVQASMERLWRHVRWAQIRRRPRPAEPPPAASTPAGQIRAAFVIRDNLRHRRDIEESYLEAIRAARREIILANAYFLPGRRFRQALVEAARRGVRITLLLQGRVEYVLQHYATQALYPHFLAHGIRIYEYMPSFLHAKVAVIDDQWATVGSSNIDPFSLLLAREANVVIADQGFARALHARLKIAIQTDAIPLRAQEWERRPLVARVASWAAYSLVRFALGLTGYGGRNL
ncbi:MAG: cardiolipin synthase ClsB [Zoogloeaceae bacterium]|nr:cardiolipin synthase ClsB [Zoogloeaceae bacterium]